MERKDVKSDTSLLYELIGIIHVPGYPENKENIGYYLRNITTGKIQGWSESEARQLLNEHGSVNARAVSRPGGVTVIEIEDSMPAAESKNWKIPAWRKSGDLFAPLSEEAYARLNHALEAASQHLADELAAGLSFETDISQKDLYAVKEAVSRAEKIAVLTGAGVSTMSGIPDYRSVAMGMWQRNPQLLEHLNEYTFQQDPDLFWRNFYLLLKNTLRPLMPFDNHLNLMKAMKAIRANEAHLFFSWLEQEKEKSVTIITQNVDRLHQQAGSKKVIEFHGNVLECSCQSCGRIYQLADVLAENTKPSCMVCGGELRPDAVFFGDPVKGIEESVESIESADAVIAAGTSLQVYPFSSLLNHASSEVTLVCINGEEPEEPAVFDYVLTGNLSSVFRELKKMLIN